jgi:transposase
VGHLEGASRDQRLLFPDVRDDSIAAENPVRFIEAFVDGLDVDALGFRRVQPATTGRPSSHPGALLTRYLYGYRHRIRSSRRLELETQRHVELLWLLRKLHPDVKTMADFRTDHAPAFKHVLRAFTRLCKEWGLFGAELVATDGSKFKAVTNKPRDVTRAKRRDRLHAVDAKLAQYLRASDAADAAAAAAAARSATALREPSEPLRERKGREEPRRAALEARGERQLSLTDPDSRARPKSPKVDVGDNVQTAVDATRTLIVEQPVTDAVPEVEQLSAMAMAAPETLGGNICRSWRLWARTMARASTPGKQLALSPIGRSRGRLRLARWACMGKSGSAMTRSTTPVTAQRGGV